MPTSFLFRWLGIGKIPSAVKTRAEAEGSLYLDEGLRGSLTYRHFHRPGYRTLYDRRAMIGSLALTRQRILAMSGKNTLVDVPWNDARIREMKFSSEDGELHILFDSSLFHDDWTGTIEYRLKLEVDPQHVVDIITDCIKAAETTGSAVVSS